MAEIIVRFVNLNARYKHQFLTLADQISIEPSMSLCGFAKLKIILFTCSTAKLLTIHSHYSGGYTALRRCSSVAQKVLQFLYLEIIMSLSKFSKFTFFLIE